MSHLSLETIARLVEDEPNAAEAAHLSSCVECRTQLDAMTQDVQGLGTLPDMAAAPDQWDALERRLTAEGLIRVPARRFGRTAMMMQAAAALLLFAGGALAGRMTAQETTPVTAAAPHENPARDAAPPPAARPPAGSLASDTDAETETPPSAVPQQPAPLRSNVTLAASGMDLPATRQDAAQYLRAAESMYLEALTRYAELAAQAESGDPVARLAALQSIILTTQAALNETPTDPVINGYHLTALAQRDATLRQVALASGEQWY
jgi:hypothetical protein